LSIVNRWIGFSGKGIGENLANLLDVYSRKRQFINEFAHQRIHVKLVGKRNKFFAK